MLSWVERLKMKNEQTLGELVDATVTQAKRISEDMVKLKGDDLELSIQRHTVIMKALQVALMEKLGK